MTSFVLGADRPFDVHERYAGGNGASTNVTGLAVAKSTVTAALPLASKKQPIIAAAAVDDIMAVVAPERKELDAVVSDQSVVTTPPPLMKDAPGPSSRMTLFSSLPFAAASPAV